MTDEQALEALHEDLIKDWQEQKKLVKEQVILIDPMATSLRKSMAQRFLNASWNVIMEILMYLLSIASIAYIFFINNIGPFYVIDKVATDPEIVRVKVPQMDMDNLGLSLKGIFILLAILFFIIGRMLANIRSKNATLSLAGKNMKTISGQMLQRKSTIEAIEQRHIAVLPKTDIIVDSVQSIDRVEETHKDSVL